MRFLHDFSDLVNAGFSCLYVTTYEEERVTEQIKLAAANPSFIKVPRKVYIWTQTKGIVCEDGNGVGPTTDPSKAMDHVEKSSENAIFIFKDFHIYFGADRTGHIDYKLVRKLRDILPTMEVNRKTIVFVSPRQVIPADLEKDISVVDFDLPSEQELEAALDNLMLSLNPEKIHLIQDEKKALVSAAMGLTLQEAENAYSRAIVKNKGLDINAVSVVHEEKNQTIKKTGLLEFVKSDLSIDDIGGLENLKKWLIRRNNSWTGEAKKYDLPAPKGVLLTGVPGCGKSLTAKATSAIWNLPLLKMDMGKIFDGIVGSSEENIRKAITTAEAVAPCILWVDEIEKGFAGLRASGDSGTSARVFGTFLTWMQEKKAPVFVFATANDISALPPEMLRKGRFDEIFFTDLPTRREREKIFELHINKRLAKSTEILHEIKVTPELCTRLAELTKGYVGAEIEQIVISAMYEAFYNRRGLIAEDIVKSIKSTVPLSATQKEQILALRRWAADRAVLATAPEDREDIQAHDDGTDTDGKDFREKQGGRILDFDL